MPLRDAYSTHTGRQDNIHHKQSDRSQNKAFLVAFSIAVTSALVLLAVLRLAPLPVTIFSEPDHRWILDSMPADEVADAKMRHAANQPAYDIGLFGNSRILMIGQAETDVGGVRLFNFAIGGQSIRQSVLLLDYLHDIGKLPGTVVISMDHVEIGLPGLDGRFPLPPRRWGLRILDSIRIWQQWGWRAAAVQMVNSIAAEAESFAVSFSRVYVTAKVAALTGLSPRPSQYRADGSREDTRLSAPPDLRLFPGRADHYPLLEQDFALLGQLKKAGTRIIIYESPLSPGIATATERGLTPRARDVRQRMRVACKQNGLQCHPAPAFTGAPWIDRDHPPAGLLGPWLSALIMQSPT